MIINYKTNLKGLDRYRYVSKNVIQIFIIVPIVHAFIIWLVYLSVGAKSMLFFYAMLVWIFSFLIFSFYSTLRQLSRQNRTLIEINFSNENLIFKTDKILWLNAREFKVDKSILRFESRIFRWYGQKTEKEGLSIFVDSKELFLVKDYFDDYVDIIKYIKSEM
jgi:hypothetical protein